MWNIRRHRGNVHQQKRRGMREYRRNGIDYTTREPPLDGSIAQQWNGIMNVWNTNETAEKEKSRLWRAFIKRRALLKAVAPIEENANQCNAEGEWEAALILYNA